MGRRFRGRILSFGRAKDAGLRAVAVEDRGALGLKARVTWEGRGGSFRLPQGGRARLYQALAALAGSLAAGGDWKALLARLDGFRMASRGRQQLEAWKGAHVLLDTYNASPQSMDAALELLETSAAPGKRVAALGDMLELGRASARLHRELGRRAARAGLKALAAMGPQAPELLKGFGRGEARAFGRNEAAEAARWLAGRVRPGDWVLMKGSRGMAVERIFQAMKEA
jgi:UDP-N-acetylmuramyl pentapeptide synthase